MSTTQLSLAEVVILLTIFPHTSATALCTSGSHFGRTSENAAQVVSIVLVLLLVGMRTYLKKAVYVASRTVSVSADGERVSSVSSRVKI